MLVFLFDAYNCAEENEASDLRFTERNESAGLSPCSTSRVLSPTSYWSTRCCSRMLELFRRRSHPSIRARVGADIASVFVVCGSIRRCIGVLVYWCIGDSRYDTIAVAVVGVLVSVAILRIRITLGLV